MTSIIFISITGLCIAAVFFFNRTRRGAINVLVNLSEQRDEENESQREKRSSPAKKAKSHNLPETNSRREEYLEAGFLRREEWNEFQKRQKLMPVIAGGIGTLLGTFLGGLPHAVLFGLLGLSGAYLVGRRALYQYKKKFLYDIDFFLPIVMERLVMTAQAGLDVFSGIRVITQLAREEERANKEPIDPVTTLLEQVNNLNEKGIGFEDALSQVSSAIESAPLRHAFIHLAVAQKEGGELVSPLRELSDSTQNYFQETIEEQIAKLPVLATMPLLLTFAGLVIFFMTSPMIQIMKISQGGGGVLAP